MEGGGGPEREGAGCGLLNCSRVGGGGAIGLAATGAEEAEEERVGGAKAEGEKEEEEDEGEGASRLRSPRSGTETGAKVAVLTGATTVAGGWPNPAETGGKFETLGKAETAAGGGAWKAGEDGNEEGPEDGAAGKGDEERGAATGAKTLEMGACPEGAPRAEGKPEGAATGEGKPATFPGKVEGGGGYAVVWGCLCPALNASAGYFLCAIFFSFFGGGFVRDEMR